MRTGRMRKKGNKTAAPFSMVEKAGFAKAALLLAACAGLVACTVEKDVGDELRELKKGQKAILERIEKIEKELAALPQARPRQRPSVDYDRIYDIEVGESPVRGAKDARVTLVEFSDFQCPYSQRVRPLIDKLLEAYPADLRHVFKNFPLGFHKEAMPAAKACMAGGMQGKFWEMWDLVLKNPKKLSDTDLKKYARRIGLDLERFEKDFVSEEVQRRVDADLEEARKAQVTGTPTLFLNGKRVRDRSEQAMKQQIQAILKGEERS